MSKNSVTLQGNLIKDPIVKGKTTRMTIAVDHQKRVGDKYEKTGSSLINLLAFNDLATEVAEKFKKGAAIDIEGSLHAEEYKNKDGVTTFPVEVWVSKVTATVFGKKKAAATEEAKA
jgi:single-stranded DNA-binding protein